MIRAAPPASRIRRAYRLLTIVGLQVAGTIFLGEIAVRLFAHLNHRVRILTYDARNTGRFEEIYSTEDLLAAAPLGFVPYADIAGFRLNSKSFRTKEYSGPKAKRTLRVVAIGDSFTMASGMTPYRQHWTTLLEKGLSAEIPEDVELINLGVGGVGPRFELRLWQLEGANLNPDIVILGLCIGNDFTDEVPPVESRASRLLGLSYVVRLAVNIFRMQQAGVLFNGKVPSGPTSADDGKTGGYEIDGFVRYENIPTMARETFLRVVGRRMQLCRRADLDQFERLSEGIEQILLKFQRDVAATGARFLLVLIPEEFQVDAALARDAAHQAGRSVDEYDLDLPQRRLKAFCVENHLPVLDLLPGFRSSNHSGSFYNLQDTHWNAAGNVLAGEIILKRILKEQTW